MHTPHQHGRRSWTARVACAAGVLALSAPLAACSDEPTTADPAPAATSARPGTGAANGPRYAFAGANTFAVATAGSTTLRQAPAAGRYGQPEWTAQGRFAAAVSQPENIADAVVAVIDTESGKITSIPCGCISVALVGASTAVWAKGGEIFQTDLAGTPAPAKIDVKLPSGKPQSVTAGSADSFLVVGSTAAAYDNGKGALYRAGLTGGKATLIGSFPEFNTLQVAVAQPGTGRLAYSVVKSQGDCAHPGPIFVTDAAGKAVATDTTAVRAGRSADEVDVGVSSAWWDTDGTLFAVLQSWVCDFEGGKPVTKPSVWRLDGNRWAQVTPAPLTVTRRLAGGTATVTVTDGQLTLDGVPVATGVETVSPAPATA